MKNTSIVEKNKTDAKKLYDTPSDSSPSAPEPESKVVKREQKSKSIDFADYMFIDKHSLDFTTLTPAQKDALKKIEAYWINRVRNYKNWKYGNHWSYRKESLSSRIDKKLYDELHLYTCQRIIKNFVRKFLINKDFRNHFYKVLEKQYTDDIPKRPSGYDTTAWMQELIEMFPCVVSGEVRKVEKDLFVLYCNFCTDFSVSYTLRIALMHFREIEGYKSIKKDEVLSILSELITDRRDSSV